MGYLGINNPKEQRDRKNSTKLSFFFGTFLARGRMSRNVNVSFARRRDEGITRNNSSRRLTRKSAMRLGNAGRQARATGHVLSSSGMNERCRFSTWLFSTATINDDNPTRERFPRDTTRARARVAFGPVPESTSLYEFDYV